MKKRVLFILNHLEIGGAEKVLITFLKNLDYSYYDVEILLVYFKGLYIKDIPVNVKIRYLFTKSNSFLEKVFRNLYVRFGVDLYSFFVKMRVFRRYDIIISFIGGSILKYHKYILDFAKTNISWVHTDLLILEKLDKENYFCTKKEQKEIYEKMDKIVFVSNDAIKQFGILYPQNMASKYLVYNPIDKCIITQFRKEYKRNYVDRCFNIVSVGRLSGEKGFDRLIRLAKRLKVDGYNFHINIIGDGYQRRELKNLIEINAVENNISLLGFLNPPYEVMSNADLFVLCSKLEGFSLVVAEAFCLGLPVISTKTTGPVELLDNDRYGILTEHDDDSIYKAVKRMIDDDFLREYYHNKSLERAEFFDIKCVMNTFYSIL